MPASPEITSVYRGRPAGARTMRPAICDVTCPAAEAAAASAGHARPGTQRHRDSGPPAEQPVIGHRGYARAVTGQVQQPGASTGCDLRRAEPGRCGFGAAEQHPRRAGVQVIAQHPALKPPQATVDVDRHGTDPVERTTGCVLQPQPGFHRVNTLPVATQNGQARLPGQASDRICSRIRNKPAAYDDPASSAVPQGCAHSRLDNDTPASVQISRICTRHHRCRHAPPTAHSGYRAVAAASDCDAV